MLVEKVYVEKKFWIQKEKELQHCETLLKELPKMYLTIAEEIFEKTGDTIDNSRSARLLIGLADHISFAVERLEHGISYENHLLWELKAFYPKEFETGLWAVELINESCFVRMPEEEAGNIACHIINAQTKHLEIKDTIQSIQMLKDILRIIKMSFSGKKIHENNCYFSMVTHLQYFIRRVLEKNMMPGKNAMTIGFYIKKYRDAYHCVEKITSYVESKLKIKITDGEKLYILVHLSRSTAPIG